MKKIKIFFLLIIALVLSSSVYSVDEVVAEEVITNDAINVEGFQIRTNDTDEVGVAFRAVCKAPKIGSIIATVNGDEYKVKHIGTIYSLDINGTFEENDIYLNPEVKTYTYEDGSSYQYLDGENTVYTKGYIATEKGIMTDWNESDAENTYYIRTMTKCDLSIATKYYVRAFVIAQNESGDEIVVYGNAAREITIAEVADYLYINSMASNFQGHMFLYNKILNVASDVYNENPYYRDTMIDYGWNNNLFTPEQPTTIYPTEYGKE